MGDAIEDSRAGLSTGTWAASWATSEEISLSPLPQPSVTSGSSVWIGTSFVLAFLLAWSCTGLVIQPLPLWVPCVHNVCNGPATPGKHCFTSHLLALKIFQLPFLKREQRLRGRGCAIGVPFKTECSTLSIFWSVTGLWIYSRLAQKESSLMGMRNALIYKDM